MQIQTAGLLVVKNNLLLLAFSNNRKAFYLPGGKVDKGEKITEALCREIKEELNIAIQEDKLKFYTQITAPAFGEKDGIIMEQDCFLYDMHETPNPSAEIGSLEYFDMNSYLNQEAQVPGVIMILEKLQKDGLIMAS